MDSDSSEEDNNCFKEAVDVNFFTDDLFKQGTINQTPERVNKKPSLRMIDEKSSFNPFNIQVTLEYQKYVSKHLTKMLDSSIKEKEVKRKCVESEKDSGIKLLRTSTGFAKESCDEDLAHHRKKNRDTKKHIDYESRAKEAAVSADWILSGVEVKNWSTNVKGIVEVVKIKKKKRKIKESLT